MPIDDIRPNVMPSQINPDIECVRADKQDPAGDVATPPDTSPTNEDPSELCPEGYVPRLRRRDYDLDGKLLVTDGPPERNPDPPSS